MNNSKIPKQYVPKSLTPEDTIKQIKSIKEGKDRPKVDSFKSKRSSHVVKFEKKYGTKITDDDFISKNIISKTGINKILSKGRGAYYSSGIKTKSNRRLVGEGEVSKCNYGVVLLEKLIKKFGINTRNKLLVFVIFVICILII